ncbi:MAG: hypothetical protein JF593_02220 [Novosphingobium sp.]|nr:hypothetical protein [Novosphingobium sp.]
MVDYFAIGLTHLLLGLAAWRLMRRDDLDRDPGNEDEPVGRKVARRRA